MILDLIKKMLGKNYELSRQTAHKFYNFLSVIAFYGSGEYFRNKKRLVKLQNSYIGKRCFVVCNGPSLKAEDLTKIHDNKDISFGMNSIARVYDATSWRPNFLSLTDDGAFSVNNKEMCINCEAGIKIFDRSRYLRTLSTKGRKIYLSFNETTQLLDYPVFCPNAFARLPSIATSTYALLEFVVFLGFRRIYIIGCDMSYAVNITRDGKIYYSDSKKEHFYKQDVDDVQTSNVEPYPTWKMEVAFNAAAKWAMENGVEIYNATRGGMLESFTRVDFDSLFN